jgi:hypothetical protein
MSAQHYGWPFAVAEQSNHTRLAYPGRHLVASFPELVGRNAGRSRLMHRQFGMGVNVFIKRFKIG